MATVTYHNQPGIHRTRGTVPLAGTKHLYTVDKLLWPPEVEDYLRTLFIGRTLHACCGKSMLGDIRLDLYEANADVRADAARLPFADRSFDTVLCDPPYNGVFRWMHDVLNELHRVAGQRIIYQHWYSPVNPEGRFKKAHIFYLSELDAIPQVSEDDLSESFALTGKFAWMPRTYFGRMQFISVFDREEQ